MLQVAELILAHPLWRGDNESETVVLGASDGASSHREDGDRALIEVPLAAGDVLGQRLGRRRPIAPTDRFQCAHPRVDDRSGGAGRQEVSSSMAASRASHPDSESRPRPLPATSIAAATSATVSRFSLNT
jgi:hypothetical protein